MTDADHAVNTIEQLEAACRVLVEERDAWRECARQLATLARNSIIFTVDHTEALAVFDALEKMCDD